MMTMLETKLKEKALVEIVYSLVKIWSHGLVKDNPYCTVYNINIIHFRC